MKKASMVLGISGGVIGLIVSLICISVSAGGIDMSGSVGSMYIRQFVFGIIGTAGAVLALVGASIVFKSNKLSCIFMFAGAITSLYTLLGIVAFFLLLLGGIFAVVKEKSHSLANNVVESKMQTSEGSSTVTAAHEKGIAGVVLGIVFGMILLLISYLFICLTFWTDACTPADPILYEEMMEDAAQIYPFEVVFIVLGGLGTLGAVACIAVPVSIKRNRRISGRILGILGSSIIMVTVIITVLSHKVPLTYPSVSPHAYSAFAFPSSVLGFTGSLIINKKLIGGILLLVSAAALSFEIYLQTMVFTGAGALLLLISGLLVLIKDKNA